MTVQQMRSRYAALYGVEPTAKEELAKMEGQLNIRLPADLKQIAEFYAGGMLGEIPLLSIDCRPQGSICSETLRLRRTIGLHCTTVLLADMSYSLIAMRCLSEGARNIVIWYDAAVFSRIASHPLPDNDPAAVMVWETYAAFFIWLLEEEEKSRFN